MWLGVFSPISNGSFNWETERTRSVSLGMAQWFLKYGPDGSRNAHVNHRRQKGKKWICKNPVVMFTFLFCLDITISYYFRLFPYRSPTSYSIDILNIHAFAVQFFRVFRYFSRTHRTYLTWSHPFPMAMVRQFTLKGPFSTRAPAVVAQRRCVDLWSSHFFAEIKSSSASSSSWWCWWWWWWWWWWLLFLLLLLHYHDHHHHHHHHHRHHHHHHLLLLTAVAFLPDNRFDHHDLPCPKWFHKRYIWIMYFS